MKILDCLGNKVSGVLQGLDRIRFRGTLRDISHTSGVTWFMREANMLLKDFWEFAESRTQALRTACASRADVLGIPCIYLNSSKIDKEEKARSIAAERMISSGPICLFSVVEPCLSPLVKGNRETKKLELVMAERKCVFLYFYFDHPEFGFGHVRLQTWFPYGIHVCLNGRHWLEKQLLAHDVRFRKSGNCFRGVDDPALAQRFLDEQLTTDWNKALGSLLGDMLPDIGKVLAPVVPNYYWSADETEFATDLMFRSASTLDALFPRLTRHAMATANSPAVMRFLGRNQEGGNLPDEVVSDCRRRYEGVRVKHYANMNSVKMYNKAGSVLRIETTINNTRAFKVYRKPDDRPDAKPSWQKMRKGVADLHRRCEISAKCNERYADALLPACTPGEKLQEAVSSVCRPTTKDKRRARALNLLRVDDQKILRFIGDGKLAMSGFRNKDLCAHLFGQAAAPSAQERRQRSGKTTRLIFLLRAHGLVQKVPTENRYMVTPKGQKIAAAILAASEVEVEKLMQMAA